MPAVFTVREGQGVVVERWGKYRKTLGPGFHAIVPGVDKVHKFNWSRADAEIGTVAVSGFRVPTVYSIFNPPKIVAVTKDGVYVLVDLCLSFAITDPKRACCDVDDPFEALGHRVAAEVKTFISKATLAATSSHAVAKTVRVDLTEFEEKWGIGVEDVSVKSIESVDHVHVVERQRNLSIERARAENDLHIQNERAKNKLAQDKLEHVNIVERLRNFDNLRVELARNIDHLRIEFVRSKNELIILRKSAENELSILRKSADIELEIAHFKDMSVACWCENQIPAPDRELPQRL